MWLFTRGYTIQMLQKGTERLCEFQSRWPLTMNIMVTISKWAAAPNEKSELVGGVSLLLWKMMEWKSVGMIKFPIYGENKSHVPNHQAEKKWKMWGPAFFHCGIPSPSVFPREKKPIPAAQSQAFVACSEWGLWNLDKKNWSHGFVWKCG